MPQTLGIDHIAVAVSDLDEATRLWSEVLGLRVGGREVVEDQGVEVQMMYAGDTRVELLRPIREDSPVAAFLARKGPGLHHLALAVDDCAGGIERATAAGAQAIDAAPRGGAHGTRIAFLHPRSTGWVLTELCEGGEGPWQNEETE